MNKHAQITVSVDRYDPLSSETLTEIQMTGCRQCLVKAITKVLLGSNAFKDVINQAVRAANEERAKKQN